MKCEERTHLLKLCAVTMRAYTRASIKWQELTARANTAEYRKSMDARQEARAQVDLAHYQLERHEALHLCHLPTQQ
jgi:hypothetical protein